MNLNPARTRTNVARGRLAAVHGQGAFWRVVVADAAAEEKVVAAREMARGDVATLGAMIDEFDVRRVVVVAPAGQTIAKLTAMPRAESGSVASALKLLGEVHLPAQVPGHRRGFGAFNGTAHGAEMHALITGWVGDVDALEFENVDVSYTSEAAAWLSLVEHGEPGVIVSADRSGGSICIASTEPDASFVRTIREQGEDEGEWREHVERAIAESFGDSGASEAERAVGGEEWLIRAPQSMVDDVSRQLAPMQVSGSALVFGPALGAAMGAMERGTEAGSLFGLQSEARRDRRNILQRTAAMLGGRAWAAVLVVSLVLVLLVPLGAAAARYAILNVKSGGMQEQEARKSEMVARLALYRELEQRRWPMTKLISHIASALPVGESGGEVTAGVTLESMRLDAGRGERVLLSGRAESFELLNKLLRNLSESGVFSDVKADRSQVEEGDAARPLVFDISMMVIRPFAEPRGLGDFSENTLAVRLYGEEGAARLAERGRTYRGDGESRAPARRNGAGARNDNSGAEQSEETSGRARRNESASGPEPIPPALSEAEIGGLDRQATMREFGNRRRAVSRSDIDETTRQRLNAEVEMLRNRLRALAGGGS